MHSGHVWEVFWSNAGILLDSFGEMLGGTQSYIKRETIRYQNPCNLAMFYAHIEIAVAFLVVNTFSFSIAAFYGVGVMTCEFWDFLSCLLCLPIPIRGQHSSNRS